MSKIFQCYLYLQKVIWILFLNEIFWIFSYLRQMRCYLLLNDYYFKQTYLGVYFIYYLYMGVFHGNCIYFYCFRHNTYYLFFKFFCIFMFFKVQLPKIFNGTATNVKINSILIGFLFMRTVWTRTVGRFWVYYLDNSWLKPINLLILGAPYFFIKTHNWTKCIRQNIAYTWRKRPGRLGYFYFVWAF